MLNDKPYICEYNISKVKLAGNIQYISICSMPKTR